MATLVLAAAGSALGGALGGSFAGLTTAVLGRAFGATLGSVLDQKIMGRGSDPVETGRVDRFRVMGSSEGAALPRVFGRMRLPGQVIWSSRFLESVNTENVGGKGGGGGGQTVKEYSYSVSSCGRAVRGRNPARRADLGGRPAARPVGADTSRPHRFGAPTARPPDLRH